jgi:hypothetical protein
MVYEFSFDLTNQISYFIKFTKDFANDMLVFLKQKPLRFFVK